MEIFHKAGVEILISDKIDLQTKAIERDKEWYYIVKGWIKQEAIPLVNIYAPNIGAPKCVKQILMDIKGEININKIIAGDFNTLLTSMYRYSRQKSNMETVALNGTLDEMGLIDRYKPINYMGLYN